MRRAKIIAEECGQKYISYTGDLAVAKMVMEIQEDLSPQFDHLFVHLGPFHIQMCFMKALGKFIDESGGSTD